MAKDVVYIDVEDDITTIISKVKASSEGIVALVPPNRIGVLQSAVNIRLLERSAKAAQKRVVLITNNQSLAMLAATANIPVAKNLQSKPEMAEIPVLKVDGDDIIDGDQLPVGEHAGSTDAENESDSSIDAVIHAQGQESQTKKVIKKPTGKRKYRTFRRFAKNSSLLAARHWRSSSFWCGQFGLLRARQW